MGSLGCDFSWFIPSTAWLGALRLGKLGKRPVETAAIQQEGFFPVPPDIYCQGNMMPEGVGRWGQGRGAERFNF